MRSRLGDVWLLGASLACAASVASAQPPLAIEIEAPGDAQVAAGEHGLAFLAGRVAWFGPGREALDLVLVLDVSDSTDEPSSWLSPPEPPWWRRVLARLGRPAPLEPAHTVLGDELRAARALVAELDPARTRVAVVAFAGDFDSARENAWTEVPLTHDFRAVRAALERVLRRGSGGLTDPSAGVHRALAELLGTRSALSPARGEARRAIVLLTDARGPWRFVSDGGERVPALRRAELAKARVDVFAFGEEAQRPDTPARGWPAATGGVWLDASAPERVHSALAALRYSEVDEITVRNRTTGAQAERVARDPDGGFSCLLQLAPGANQVEVVARLSDGRSAVRSLELVRADEASPPALSARLLRRRGRLLAARLHAPARRGVAVAAETPAAADPAAGESSASRMMAP